MRDKRLGYRFLRIDGKLYRAHRVAWLCMTGSWPADEIDHINGDRGDNRFANLRAATRSENSQNRAPRSASTGVEFRASANFPYRVRIKVSGKLRLIGNFKTEAEARAAYRRAKAELHPFAARFDEELS